MAYAFADCLCVIAGGTDGSLKMLRGQMQSDPYGVISTPWLQFSALFLLPCSVSFIDTVSNVNVITSMTMKFSYANNGHHENFH